MNDRGRRDFLKWSVGALAAAGFGPAAMAEQQDGPAGIPTRPLGKTGERVPIVGLGGYHIGVPDEKDAIAIMHEAIDQGMTFFDNAWDYHDGGSEEVMGKALSSDGRRKKVFLMTKVCARDYQGAQTAARRKPATAADRCDRPLAISRDQLGRGPGLDLRTWRFAVCDRSAQGRQSSLYRFHGAQGYCAPSENARQAFRLGHGADAGQCT